MDVTHGLCHHARGAMTYIDRTLSASLLLSLLVLSSGCYDTGDKYACVGFSCPAGSQWPEGGNITVSHVWLPDGVSSARTFHAYFVEDQAPEFPEPRLPGKCYPLEEPEYEFRTEIDVGPNLTIRGEGEEEFVLPRYTVDNCAAGSEMPPPNGCADGKPLDFDFVEHDIVYLAAANTNPGDGYFDSTMTTETAEPTPFSDLLTGTYMPPAVTQTKPPYGAIPIKAGQPLELGWEPRTPIDPDIVAMGTILFVDPFLAPNGGLDVFPWLCVVPNSGSYTVPGEVTAQFSPRGGIMQVGYATNQAVVTDEDRIINLFATECQASVWMLTP